MKRRRYRPDFLAGARAPHDHRGNEYLQGGRARSATTSPCPIAACARYRGRGRQARTRSRFNCGGGIVRGDDRAVVWCANREEGVCSRRNGHGGECGPAWEDQQRRGRLCVSARCLPMALTRWPLRAARLDRVVPRERPMLRCQVRFGTRTFVCRAFPATFRQLRTCASPSGRAPRPARLRYRRWPPNRCRPHSPPLRRPDRALRCSRSGSRPCGESGSVTTCASPRR